MSGQYRSRWPYIQQTLRHSITSDSKMNKLLRSFNVEQYDPRNKLTFNCGQQQDGKEVARK